MSNRTLPEPEADLYKTRQVIEYLSKKGYTKTEAMLRSESANTDKDGRPIITRAEDLGGAKYLKAFSKSANKHSNGCQLRLRSSSIMDR
jgi:hypothetical protein